MNSRLAVMLAKVTVSVLMTNCGRSGAANVTSDSLSGPLAPARLAAARFPAPARPVSSIVAPAWSDERSRDDAGEASEVFRLLGIRSGMHIADIGAGSGYYTTRLASAVGPSGIVYAEDIMPDYVRALAARLRNERVTNVRVVLGDAADPRLANRSVEVALLVHMYHEIEQPYALLENSAPALREGGRVAVLDLDRATGSHGTPPRLLECEFAAAGYRQLSFTALRNDNGYLAVFGRMPELPRPESIIACPAR